MTEEVKNKAKKPAAANVKPAKKVETPVSGRTIRWVILGVLVARFLLTLLPSHKVDMGGYDYWSHYLADPNRGFKGFYESLWVVYAPAYMYLLLISGKIAAIFQVSDLTHEFLIKSWAVLFEFGGAYLIYLIGKKLGKPKTGFWAAIFYVMNPAIFINSSIWGQFDSLFATILLAVVYCFSIKKPVYAAILFCLAVLTKPQSIFLLPLVVYVFFCQDFEWKKVCSLLWNHARAEELKALINEKYQKKVLRGEIRERIKILFGNIRGWIKVVGLLIWEWKKVFSLFWNPSAMPEFKAYFSSYFTKDYLLKVLYGAIGVIATYVIIVLPFFITMDAAHGQPLKVIVDFFMWVPRHYFKYVNDYPYATADGFNFWFLVGGQTVEDKLPFGFLTYAAWEKILLFGLWIYAVWALAKIKKNQFSLYYIAYVLGFGFFMVYGRMHERYLVPALIFTFVMVLWDAKLWVPTVIVNGCALANQWYGYELAKKDIYWYSKDDPLGLGVSLISVIILAYSFYYLYQYAKKQKIKLKKA